jgi:hypothetical protein
MVPAEASSRCIEDEEMTHRQLKNDASVIKGINQQPTYNQPTTTCDASKIYDWVAVEVEVSKCGVNQAKLVVNAASSQEGITPDCLFAVIAYWRAHLAGWLRSDVVLYRRLKLIEPGQSPTECWPPFDVPGYQARLDSNRFALQYATDFRRQAERQVERRKKYQAERERCTTERAEQPIDFRRSFEKLVIAANPSLTRQMTNNGRCFSSRYERAYGPRPP